MTEADEIRHEKCETCRFFYVPIGKKMDKKQGECRRYPPKANSVTRYFVNVRRDDWCGEHKP